MVRKPERHNKKWTKADIEKLKKLAASNTPTKLIAIKLKRTEDAVRQKASELNISLKPKDK